VSARRDSGRIHNTCNSNRFPYRREFFKFYCVYPLVLFAISLSFYVILRFIFGLLLCVSSSACNSVECRMINPLKIVINVSCILKL